MTEYMKSIHTLREYFPQYQIMSTRYDLEKGRLCQVEFFDFEAFQKDAENRFKMGKTVYYGDYKYKISFAPFSERVNIVSLPMESNSDIWNILYTADADQLL
jgi:hypothetical protein